MQVKLNKSLCVCRKDNHVTSAPPIVIDDNDIEQVTQANLLGATLCAGLI